VPPLDPVGASRTDKQGAQDEKLAGDLLPAQPATARNLAGRRLWLVPGRLFVVPSQFGVESLAV